MKLASIIRKYDRELRKYCKEQIKQTEPDGCAVWVTDNYRSCSSALKAAVGFISREGEKDLRPLFFVCKDFMASCGEISDGKIIAKFSKEELSVDQCEALPVLLFAAAAAVICEERYCKDEKVISRMTANLFKLRESDFDNILYGICAVERYLSCDPADIYDKMNGETRRRYRYAVMRGAKKKGVSENEFAKSVLSKAREQNRHIGFFLEVNENRENKGTLFIAAEWLFAAIISCIIGIFFIKNVYSPFLLLLPVYAAIRPITDIISAKLFVPQGLLALSEEAVGELNTLITVSVLLPSANKTEEMFSRLSELYSSNSGNGVKLMLLADMRNSKTPDEATDTADIAAVKRLVDRLNKKHGGGFCVAVRERVYSPTENEYTGFERKRGALGALVRYICDGNAEQFSLIYGDTKKLSEMKYIMALDSDTALSFEVLKGLVAVAEHPLNAPVYSARKKRIVSGYAVFSPRIETSVQSAEKTVFSRIFTDTGFAAYSVQVSERYMDMFGKSIFSGKGLINAEAFNKTAVNSFDEQRILSHDILEGSLLRTAFVPQSELTDSFPSSSEGYFARLHRWIRGDVQNLKYIFRPMSALKGSASMPPLGKYQLFDNVRRALTPVFVFLLLLISCFSSYYDALIYFFAGLTALIAPRLIPVVFSVCKNGLSVFSSLYFSSEIASVYKDIIRAVLDIGSLPQNVFVSLDAVIRSCYRSLISKKKLLQWTTAEDADKAKRKNLLYAGIFPFLTAAVLFVFGYSYHRLTALFILLFLPFALSDGFSLRKNRNELLSENEKRSITSFAASAWRFFEENVTERENMLPPDNIQETPVPKKAMRTSPTNIGFYLVSVLAACDMSFITASEMLFRINATLDSVDKLPKYKGLMYNWYDISKLVPLVPRYVSTVDCGNYLVCLCALKEGLKEYINVIPDAAFAVTRIEKILEESDLGFLYDEKRELFRIGFDCETGKLSDSFYDLYMSEARMTSYYECAKRHVPSEHWRSLDRSIKKTPPYVTAASWTGTMFEYFLPVMFLECRENTFQYEALKVCLSEQKRRAAKENIPYGISESCFAGVDSALNYRYKAHGLKILALKRDADEESVISPYSTFLTLPFDKKSAVKNLGKLSALHCEGIYGFYEALDFSPDRNDGDDYSVVRCYMSHHIGMSIVAMVNVLSENIFVKRFMSDIYMNSAKKLLEEKIPSSAVAMKSLEYDGKRSAGKLKKIRDNNAVPEGKDAFAYSNGEVTFFCDKFGRNNTSFAGSRIFEYSEISEGISVGVEFENGTVPLFPSDEKTVTLKQYALSSKRCVGDTELISAVTVHGSENAILIPVKLKNSGKSPVSVHLHFYMKPLLLPLFSSDSHPAFSDMFLKTKSDSRRKCVVFHRSNNEYAPAVAMGFYGGNKFEYSLDKEKIMGRTAEKLSVFERNYRFNEEHTRGVTPILAVSTPVTVQPSKSVETVFVIALGSDEESALFNLTCVRNKALPPVTKGVPASFLRDPLTADAALDVIEETFFNRLSSPLCEAAVSSVKNGINSLWQTGISGDYPIVTVFPEKNCSLQILTSYVKMLKRFLRASVCIDLVFIFDGAPDYGFTGERDLKRIISEENMSDLISAKGGIHVFYRSLLSDESFAAILSLSSCIYPDNSEKPKLENRCALALSEKNKNSGENGFVTDGYVINKKPALPWCHTLSNNTFGTLLTDRSLGYSWSLNSRQNKLTSWSNDIFTDLNGEKLYILCGEKLFDAAADSSVRYTPFEAVHSSSFGGMNVDVTTRVAKKGSRKQISVRVKNLTDDKKDIKLIYRVIPVLNEDGRYKNLLKIYKNKNCVIAENPMNVDYKGVLALGTSNENAEFFGNMKSFTGENKKALVVLQKFVIEPKSEITCDLLMCFAATSEAAEKLLYLPFIPKTEKPFKCNSPYLRLNEFASSLLYHQVSDTRVRARCGFYQCSGAFGFRDQLQDVLPLIGRENGKVRQMIFSAAAVQFPEGDVLHWFHRIPGKNAGFKGVRTRCSDDMLWLPFAVASYVEKTGDTKILETRIPFIDGEELSGVQKDNYSLFYPSKEKASLYVHCLKAIKRAYVTGRHSLPLMGSGDWNDSFDEVGLLGKGESVWLAEFLGKVLFEFAKICEIKGDNDIADGFRKIRDELFFAVDEFCWNGKWYLRGFYDDNTPLGDEGGKACRIDLLCQSWASLADMPNKERVRTALLSAYDELFDEKNGVVKLFAPPFNENCKKAGYVNKYPEGMRENGGQYTHAAVWFCMALFKEGLTLQAERVLNTLLPSVKYLEGRGEDYKTEPYALAGDVYFADGHIGRGGWSLYTGSAGWLLTLCDMLNGE